jgi:hypothetical protein
VCGDDLAAEPCGTCDWKRGLIVACQQDAGDPLPVRFVAEKRHPVMLCSGLLACALGLILFNWGIARGGTALAVGLPLGTLPFAAGVLTLKITKHGRAWWGIPGQEKARAIPGLIIGGGFGLAALLPAALLAVGNMALLFNALGDVKQAIRAGL